MNPMYFQNGNQFAGTNGAALSATSGFMAGIQAFQNDAYRNSVLNMQKQQFEWDRDIHKQDMAYKQQRLGFDRQQQRLAALSQELNNLTNTFNTMMNQGLYNKKLLDRIQSIQEEYRRMSQQKQGDGGFNTYNSGQTFDKGNIGDYPSNNTSPRLANEGQVPSSQPTNSESLPDSDKSTATNMYAAASELASLNGITDLGNGLFKINKDESKDINASLAKFNADQANTINSQVINDFGDELKKTASWGYGRDISKSEITDKVESDTGEILDYSGRQIPDMFVNRKTSELNKIVPTATDRIRDKYDKDDLGWYGRLRNYVNNPDMDDPEKGNIIGRIAANTALGLMTIKDVGTLGLAGSFTPGPVSYGLETFDTKGKSEVATYDPILEEGLGINLDSLPAGILPASKRQQIRNDFIKAFKADTEEGNYNTIKYMKKPGEYSETNIFNKEGSNVAKTREKYLNYINQFVKNTNDSSIISPTRDYTNFWRNTRDRLAALPTTVSNWFKD